MNPYDSPPMQDMEHPETNSLAALFLVTALAGLACYWTGLATWLRSGDEARLEMFLVSRAPVVLIASMASLVGSKCLFRLLGNAQRTGVRKSHDAFQLFMLVACFVVVLIVVLTC
ncbi:MAG: hypothetical protein AAFX06_11950 [Planctomycetota bacterium]